MFCSKCGTEAADTALFCTKCGTAFEKLSSAGSHQQSPPSADNSEHSILASTESVVEASLSPQRKSPWKKWILVGFLLLVLVSGGVIGWQMLAKKEPIIAVGKQQSDTKVEQKMKNPTDGAEMLWVPGGSFSMGSTVGVGNDNELPAHQVTLSGYWVYQYDVTVAQYRAFCAATTSTLPQFPSDYSWKGKTGWDDPALQQHPIVNVSWNDAKTYAEWAGVKLPTEAQWEYTARGPQGNNYPWGGKATEDDTTNGWDITKCANRENSSKVGKSTWPVGSFPTGASWCGAMDMAGNVWQWCGDWYGNYSATPVTNPTGPATGTGRVLRGGSSDGGNYNRCAFRYNFAPGHFNIGIGFRCVSTAPGP